MKLYESTSTALTYGSMIGLLVTVAGLVYAYVDGSTTLLWVGILVLILSPFYGVVASAVSLATERDWKWFKVALVLIAVAAVGVFVSAIVR